MISSFQADAWLLYVCLWSQSSLWCDAVKNLTVTVYKIWMNLNSNLNFLILTRKQKCMGTLLTGINTDSFRVSLFVFTNYELRCLFWGTIFVCRMRLWILLNKTIFYLHWLIINYVTTIDVNIYSTNCCN